MGKFITIGPLDRFSRCHYIRDRMGYPTELVFGLALKNSLAQGNDHDAKSLLTRAAQILISQDRLLSAVPFGDKELYWSGIKDPIDMNSVVKIDKSSERSTGINTRIQLVSKRYSSGIFNFADKTTPLFRLILNRAYDESEQDILVLVMPHLLGDGSSARRMLLQVLDFIENPKADVVINEDSTFPIQHTNERTLALQDVFDQRPPVVEIVLLAVIILITFIPRLLFNLLIQFMPVDKLYYSRGNEKLKNFKVSSEMGIRTIILPSLYSTAKSPAIGMKITANPIIYKLYDAALFGTCHHFSQLSNPSDSNSKYKIPSVSNTIMRIPSPNKSKVENFFGFCKHQEMIESDTLFWNSVKDYHQNITKTHRPDTRIMLSAMDFLGFSFVLTRFKTACSGIMQVLSQTFMSNLGPFYEDNNNHQGSANFSHAFFFFEPFPFAQPTALFTVSADKASDTTLTFLWRKDTVSEEWVDHFENLLQKAAKKLVDRADKPDLTLTFGSLVSSSS